MKNQKRRIYIAGPMTGIKDFNFPAFRAAAKRLVDEGWEVVNPVDFAEKVCAEKHITAEELASDVELLDQLIAEEHQIIPSCSAIYLLQGWENSGGAKLELEYALTVGLTVIVEKEGDLK